MANWAMERWCHSSPGPDLSMHARVQSLKSYTTPSDEENNVNCSHETRAKVNRNASCENAYLISQTSESAETVVCTTYHSVVKP